ncbi:hypothetical protein [Streptomyces monticola]|uniref:hypothetical protein n=1 Tax=Streptomyces monticola TaxID=2666263 RepID=UPI0036D3DD94
MPVVEAEQACGAGASELGWNSPAAEGGAALPAAAAVSKRLVDDVSGARMPLARLGSWLCRNSVWSRSCWL